MFIEKSFGIGVSFGLLWIEGKESIEGFSVSNFLKVRRVERVKKDKAKAKAKAKTEI